MTDSRSVNIPWVEQIFTMANDMENDETKRYQADLDLFGGSQWVIWGKRKKGELDMLHLKSSSWKTAFNLWYDIYNTW